MKIMLDMDGVITDFLSFPKLFGIDPQELHDILEPGVWRVEGTFAKLLNEKRGKNFSEAKARRLMWLMANNAGAKWWANLPVYPWADDLIKLCKSFGKMYFCTAIWCPAAAQGKVEWFNKVFGDDFKDYFLTSQKHLLAAPDTVLIDDCDENIDRFRKAGGSAILFPQKWNSNHKILIDKVEYVKFYLQANKELGDE